MSKFWNKNSDDSDDEDEKSEDEGNFFFFFFFFFSLLFWLCLCFCGCDCIVCEATDRRRACEFDRNRNLALSNGLRRRAKPHLTLSASSLKHPPPLFRLQCGETCAPSRSSGFANFFFFFFFFFFFSCRLFSVVEDSGDEGAAAAASNSDESGGDDDDDDDKPKKEDRGQTKRFELDEWDSSSDEKRVILTAGEKLTQQLQESVGMLTDALELQSELKQAPKGHDTSTWPIVPSFLEAKVTFFPERPILFVSRD
jgi:hypothetical protein